MMDKVPVEDLQDWKDDPVTQAFLAELQGEHERLLGQLEIAADRGQGRTANALGGRCAQLRDVVRGIKQAKGKESE